MEAVNKDPQFYRADGTLTRYSFACGYVQRVEKNGKWKELYMEHNTFHVRAGTSGQKWTIWENFESESLTKARKFYTSIKL